MENRNNNGTNRRGTLEKGSREWRVAGIMRDYTDTYPVSRPRIVKVRIHGDPDEEEEASEARSHGTPKARQQSSRLFVQWRRGR